MSLRKVSLPRPAFGRLALARLALPVTATALLVAGCAPSSTSAGSGGSRAGSGASAKDAGAATTVKITLTDTSCTPKPTKVPAGPVDFTVTSTGSGKISEAEVRSGSRILAEKENIVPGVGGRFALDLAAGTYTVTCVGSSKATPLTVTGGTSASNAALTAQLAAATTAYKAYVVDQVAQLQTATKTLTDAVRAGDIPAAQAAYAPARVFYERIEPVAESFGTLDPAIDARVDDVPLAQLTGFHKLEDDLWVANSLAGATPTADQLDADVTKLASRVATVSFQPAELANGATTLLDEVAKTKVTGEEERYSHVDLVDFSANVDGAQQAFSLLQPALTTKDPTLATTVSQRFADLQAALAPYKTGAAPSDYQSYSSVTPDARRQLSQLVDALAEPLSTVAGTIVATKHSG